MITQTKSVKTKVRFVKLVVYRIGFRNCSCPTRTTPRRRHEKFLRQKSPKRKLRVVLTACRRRRAQITQLWRKWFGIGLKFEVQDFFRQDLFHAANQNLSTLVERQHLSLGPYPQLWLQSSPCVLASLDEGGLVDEVLQVDADDRLLRGHIHPMERISKHSLMP